MAKQNKQSRNKQSEMNFCYLSCYNRLYLCLLFRIRRSQGSRFSFMTREAVYSSVVIISNTVDFDKRGQKYLMSSKCIEGVPNCIIDEELCFEVLTIESYTDRKCHQPCRVTENKRTC